MTVFYMYFYFFKSKKTLANIYIEIIKVNPRLKVIIIKIRYLLKRL